MKKRAYVLNVVENTLTLSADFVDAMNDPTSDEYKLLCQFKHDFPNLRVVRKTHATPTLYRNSDGSKTTRQKNRGLTYERMEQFMGALPNSEEYLAAYKELREKAEAMCASPYAAVNAWFRKQFPKFRANLFDYLDSDKQPKIIDFSDILAKSKAKPSVDAAEGEVKKDA